MFNYPTSNVNVVVRESNGKIFVAQTFADFEDDEIRCGESDCPCNLCTGQD